MIRLTQALEIFGAAIPGVRVTWIDHFIEEGFPAYVSLTHGTLRANCLEYDTEKSQIIVYKRLFDWFGEDDEFISARMMKTVRGPHLIINSNSRE